MNVDTKELVSSTSDLSEAEQKDFVPVPDRLHEDAIKELLGKNRVVVKNKKSPLYKWASKQKRKKSNRCKMDKTSRKKNR